MKRVVDPFAFIASAVGKADLFPARVVLNSAEIATLRRAMTICEQAHTLMRVPTDEETLYHDADLALFALLDDLGMIT